MKKLICAFLALALVLGLCVIPSFAENENLALGKDVVVDMEIQTAGDVPDMGNFWSSTFLTDGLWPAFLGSGTPELGWYSSSQQQDNVEITLELDLEDVYKIDEIKVLPQKFLGGMTFPSEYEVSISADGKNYESIGTDSHSGEFIFTSYNPGDPFKDECYTEINIPTFSAGGKAARYVLLHITKMGADPGDGLLLPEHCVDQRALPAAGRSQKHHIDPSVIHVDDLFIAGFFSVLTQIDLFLISERKHGHLLIAVPLPKYRRS